MQNKWKIMKISTSGRVTHQSGQSTSPSLEFEQLVTLVRDMEMINPVHCQNGALWRLAKWTHLEMDISVESLQGWHQ